MPSLCAHCGRSGSPSKPLKPCSQCNAVFYCDRHCQTNDWKGHKKMCKSCLEQRAVKPNSRGPSLVPPQNANHERQETTMRTQLASAGEQASSSLPISAVGGKDKKAAAATSGSRECANCCVAESHDGPTLQICAKCRLVFYCSRACQRQHWLSGHKRFCLTPAERKPARGADPATGVQGGKDASEECSICLSPLKE